MMRLEKKEKRETKQKAILAEVLEKNITNKLNCTVSDFRSYLIHYFTQKNKNKKSQVTAYFHDCSPKLSGND